MPRHYPAYKTSTILTASEAWNYISNYSFCLVENNKVKACYYKACAELVSSVKPNHVTTLLFVLWCYTVYHVQLQQCKENQHIYSLELVQKKA